MNQPPRDILSLDHLVGKRVRVKFQGGREGEWSFKQGQEGDCSIIGVSLIKALTRAKSAMKMLIENGPLSDLSCSSSA